MGGGAPKKRESNPERNARFLAARKSNQDARALAAQSDYLKRSRRRGSLLGGPESGSVSPTTLGGGMTRLGAA